MRILSGAVRAVGVLLGVFLVATSLIDIFGLMRGFDEVPRPSNARLVSDLPLLIFGVLLLIPHRFFLQGKRHLLLICGYVALVMAALAFALLGAVAYREGGKDWLILPTGLVLVAVPMSNAIVLWYSGLRARMPPDSASKPQLLQDST